MILSYPGIFLSTPNYFPMSILTYNQCILTLDGTLWIMDNGIDMFLTSLKFIYYHHFIDVMWMTELLGF